jgi:K+-sensing histidine kinase KdpD
MVRWPGLVTVVFACAATAAVAGGSVAVRGEVDNTNVALAVAAVIVLAAFGGGVLAGGLASVSGAVAFDVFQTKPYGSLRIAGTTRFHHHDPAGRGGPPLRLVGRAPTDDRPPGGD